MVDEPMRPIKIGFVMDPVEMVNVKKDTTLALIEAALGRGWTVFYITQENLRLDHGVVRAKVQVLNIDLSLENWWALSSVEDIALSELDALLMRVDPPFNMDYIYSTYLLERAEKDGLLVVNSPRSLRDCNEKLFATEFPDCCPPLLVTSDTEELRAFYSRYHDVIYKPLDGMGGAAIFRAKPEEHNLSVILEVSTNHGKHPIMAQKYLPEIKQGDKRILMVDGKAIPYCLARIPSQGETRGNLAAGGVGEVRPLTERDQWIANEVGPSLRARGLMFVGLDVIGDYLTEINVTSPTCAREIDRDAGTNIGEELMVVIERRLKDGSN